MFNHPDIKEVLSSVRNLANLTPLIGRTGAASNRFFAATSRLPISNLGRWERAIRNELYSAVYGRRSLNLWVTRKPHDPWLNLFNGDGFRREAALRAISAGAPNSFLFAVMLRRLNDWVPQVRDAAREAVRRTASKTGTEIIVEVLWGILPHLHTWRRLQDEDKEELADLVCVGDVPKRLASRIMRSSSGPAASVLSQACRRSALDNYLARIADESVQPAVRARAYKTMFEGRVNWLEGRKWVWTVKYWCKGRYDPVLGKREIRVDTDQLEILRKAAKDRSPAVRRIAGTTVIAKLPELGQEALPLAKLLAADPYPSIAERGRFALDRIA